MSQGLPFPKEPFLGGEQALSLGERLRGLSFCSFIMMGKLFKPAEAGAR
ncbi:MAG: hypothetical protein ACW980_24775 [Promethearchaeota archaeon]